jgi:hypothetical protein
MHSQQLSTHGPSLATPDYSFHFSSLWNVYDLVKVLNKAWCPSRFFTYLFARVALATDDGFRS